MLLTGISLVATAGMFTVRNARADARPSNDKPTKENALKAEEELSHAMRTNDAGAFCRLLDPDWAVVNGNGGLGDNVGMGNSVCDAIRSGMFLRKTYEPDLAHARVRVYDTVATITFNLSLSGEFNHKNFAVKEVQTDVLNWENGAWKCVLTHETIVRGSLVEGHS